MKLIGISIFILYLSACGGGNGDLGGSMMEPGEISFSTSSYTVTEDAGTFLITVRRKNGGLGNVSVTYTIVSSTAALNSDYFVLQQDVLIFAEGETSKTILVSLFNDSYVEGTENIIFELGNPTSNATIVSPSSTTLEIIDDDSPGVIQFTTSTVTRDESSGTVQLDVRRSEGTAPDVSVDYVITSGTAIAALDYENVNLSGTLNFDAGVTERTINITLIDDDLQEGAESFSIRLENSVFATLGAQNNITFTIIDNDVPPASGNSVSFVGNTNYGDEHEYARQTDIPTGFGDGEFTLQLWVKLDNSYPVGSTSRSSGNKALNWSDADYEPYSTSDWWWEGNFLLDGHNNPQFQSGTFSIQVYGGGRIRWLFGDGALLPVGGSWAVQAYPASTTSSLLDDNWHQIVVVRRWSGASSAKLELWIDGGLIATETSDRRTNMRNYWDTWNTFPNGQEGWFWGAEKNAVLRGYIYEDYKGLLDEVRFWARALTSTEISSTYYQQSVTGSEQGLVGVYHLDEGAGMESCNQLDSAQCLTMILPSQGWNIWDTENGPLL